VHTNQRRVNGDYVLAKGDASDGVVTVAAVQPVHNATGTGSCTDLGGRRAAHLVAAR
jgi:hypothetical protein